MTGFDARLSPSAREHNEAINDTQSQRHPAYGDVTSASVTGR